MKFIISCQTVRLNRKRNRNFLNLEKKSKFRPKIKIQKKNQNLGPKNQNLEKSKLEKKSKFRKKIKIQKEINIQKKREINEKYKFKNLTSDEFFSSGENS